jgi:hypothetical protein
MNSILDQLTDLGLRRLFKFVLKRAIGRYLKDELTLDQLEVKSREGLVRLLSLEFNCQLLNNEYFKGLNIRLKSAIMTSLEAKLSYSSILSEGFTIKIDKITVEVEMNQNKCDDRSNKEYNSNAADIDTANNRLQETAQTEELHEQTSSPSEGVAYIANWIEVFIASLKLEVKDVIINIHATFPTARTSLRKNKPKTSNKMLSSHYLSIHLPQLQFFNTHPGINY